MRVLNLTECLRVSKADIRLSVDSDCNEQRAAAAGHRFMRKFAFLCREDSEVNGDIFVSDSFTVSSVTQANSLL